MFSLVSRVMNIQTPSVKPDMADIGVVYCSNHNFQKYCTYSCEVLFEITRWTEMDGFLSLFSFKRPV